MIGCCSCVTNKPMNDKTRKHWFAPKNNLIWNMNFMIDLHFFFSTECLTLQEVWGSMKEIICLHTKHIKNKEINSLDSATITSVWIFSLFTRVYPSFSPLIFIHIQISSVSICSPFSHKKMHKFPAAEVQSCNTVQIFLLSKYLCVKHLKNIWECC